MIGRIHSGFNIVREKVSKRKDVRYANDPVGLSSQPGRSGTLEGLRPRNLVGQKVTVNPKNSYGENKAI